MCIPGYKEHQRLVEERTREDIRQMLVETYLPTMTQEEFVEHIEEDDFFRKYGNPVIIRAESGNDCVAMSVQLYDRIAEKCGCPNIEQMLKVSEEHDL